MCLESFYIMMFNLVIFQSKSLVNIADIFHLQTRYSLYSYLKMMTQYRLHQHLEHNQGSIQYIFRIQYQNLNMYQEFVYRQLHQAQNKILMNILCIFHFQNYYSQNLFLLQHKHLLHSIHILRNSFHILLFVS